MIIIFICQATVRTLIQALQLCRIDDVKILQTNSKDPNENIRVAVAEQTIMSFVKVFVRQTGHAKP